MTMMTSDGKEFVYVVFGADGYECESLEAIFATEQLAKDYITKLKSGPMDRQGSEYSDSAEFYGRADLLEVRVIEVRQSINGDNETIKLLDSRK